MLALIHVPSPNMQYGERTHVAPSMIDYDLAFRQWAMYWQLLRRLGVGVRTLDVNRDQPDCVFIEDTAIVLDEIAVLASMGAKSRMNEPARMESVLAKYRIVQRIEPPGTVEGGDVLQLDRTILIGLSARTNHDGMNALRTIVRRRGYRAVCVAVGDCLHLKTACSALPDGTLLVNPNWVDMEDLCGFETIRIPEEEPWGANTLPIGQTICLPAEHPRTADLLRKRGFDVETVELSEFAKAEGGITCLSILLKGEHHPRREV